MGLTGLSIAWRLADSTFGAPAWISELIATIAVVSFLAIVVAYAVKVSVASDRVWAEFRHPIAGNLFGTALVSALLLPIVIAPWSLRSARLLWYIGASGMIVFAWIIVSRWLRDRQQVAHATPAWIVPVVGLLDVPLALPSLDLPPMPELMMFSLAVGLFFAIPLFTLIFSRIVFEEPLPANLQPTLLILVAPIAVGFSTYVVTMGHIDRFAEALYLLMLFVLSVLMGRLRQLPQCCPFRIAWWAVSFPLAASAIAAFKFEVFDPNWFTRGVAWLLLLIASLTIAGLLVRTMFGVFRGELKTLSS
jgi:tellurite resistance protein